MQLGLYAHPADLRQLRARGELGRLVELGFTEVVLAAAYHAGRWLTPQGEGGVVRYLEDGTVYFPPQQDYGELRARPNADAFALPGMQELLAELAGLGLGAAAWVVAFHNSRLGRMHRHHCVRNAFGDRYTHALCPARDEVRAYGRTLLADVAALGFSAVELEAFGWMGHKHGSHHDKTSFAFDPVTDYCLSYCLCDACRAGLRGAGADPDAIEQRLQQVLRARLREGDALSPPAVAADPAGELAGLLGEAELAAMLDHRQSVLEAVLQDAAAALPEAVARTAHVEPAPWFTGSQLGLPVEVAAAHLHGLRFTHYGQSPARIEAAWDDRGRPPCPARICLHPKAPEFTGDDDLRRVAALARRLDLEGLSVYHLGLLPWRTIERAARALKGDR